MDLAQRPPYDTIDFKSLTKTSPEFKSIWQQSSGRLNFQDLPTLQALSRAILKSDFDLTLDIPSDRLCPPIPNRWNYVTFIHGLLDSTSPSYSSRYDPDRKITGLDIGTGASGIYAMLCLKSRPNWHMCATDIDKKSFESAARNLALNSLLTRSTLLQTQPTDPLVPLKALGVSHLDFTVCNPPFFASESEMSASLSGSTKSDKPNAVCTGSVNEMVAEGGDLGFVMRLVEQSFELREKVSWYSSLCGKLSTAKAIIDELKKREISNWAVGTIETGGSAGGTKRWVVAWSFGDLRPRNSIARHATIGHEYLPFPTTYSIPLPASTSPAKSKEILTAYFSSLDLTCAWDDETSTAIVEASQNVWSRAYRRAYEKRKREGGMEVDASLDAGARKVELAVRVLVLGSAREVELNWLRGTSQVLWESFCGVVHSKLK